MIKIISGPTLIYDDCPPIIYRESSQFGFYANSGRAKTIKKVRQLILETRSMMSIQDEDIEQIIQSLAEYKAEQCPKCGEGIMVAKEGIAPSGSVYIEVADTS